MSLSPKAFGRSVAIDTESHRLRGMITRTEAAQRRCQAEQDRDLYEGELLVWRGLLSVLDRALATQPRPDTRSQSSGRQSGGGV